MANLLHSVPITRIHPDHFLACIEIPAHSKNKYEFDEESGALMLDRILYTSTHYPHNYGFIPKTWGLDNDPVDVLVICSEPIVPMALVRCHPIGLMRMVDGGESDEKIIAVCENDPFYSDYKNINELPAHVADEIRHFFTHYKSLEGKKKTEIEGFAGPEEAKQVIERAIARYHAKFD